MKKTLLIVSLLSCGVAIADLKTIEIHDTVFTTLVKNDGTDVTSGIQGYNPGQLNLYVVGGTTVQGNLDGKKYNNTLQGLYVENGAGFRLNGDPYLTTMTYVYIAKELEFITSAAGVTSCPNQINWAESNGEYIKISNTKGAWLDIDADYGSKINLTAMSGGSVYLNDNGQLSSVLGNNNTVYANFITDKNALTDNALYTVDDTSITRTLLKGDYSAWSGDVVINGLDSTDYVVVKNTEGLSVKYALGAIPEPSTASLSLLSLLGLVALRRRK